MTARGLRRTLAGALVIVGLGVAGLACPARDLTVQVTDEGIQTAIVACESFRSACAKGPSGKCNRNLILCDPNTCKPRDVCEIEGHPEWASEKAMAVALLLVEAKDGDIKLRRKSACVPLNLKPCVRELGCAGAPPEARGCVTERVSQAVTKALGDGFTFDGFDSLEDVLLTLAIYRKPADEESCDDVTVEPSDCARANLVAAAGLAAPPGGSTFDITCASCQGGAHTSFGRDNGPCPVTDGACFMMRVARLLEDDENR